MPSDILNQMPFVKRFYRFPSISSTNDFARSLAEFPDDGIFVIQADCQTDGRGRMGASFFSSTESGLWATILIPLPALEHHFIHNRALSLAIAEAAEELTSCAVACTIKWPNDIYAGDRKLCGMLLENHLVRSDMLVMGFGINVTTAHAEFPKDLQPIATSLFIETGKRYSRSLLLELIISRYQSNLGRNVAESHAAYTERLYRRGALAEIEGKRGIFEDVEIDGRLRLLSGHEVLYRLAGHLRFPEKGEPV